MSEAAHYRRLAALILLWGLVPLPWLYIIQPPFWAAAAVIGAWLAVKPESVPALSMRTRNLLGLVILAAVVAAGGARVGPLRPLGHLLLLLTAVRTVAIRDRRGFLGALPALFLVWLVALTSSTHVTVVLYFVGSAAVWWWVGMEVHLLGLVPPPAAAGRPLVRFRHAVSAAALALLLGVPVFLVMPRLRSPWVVGRGGFQSVTGFSSHVRLSGVGVIRRSHDVALEVRTVSGQPLRQEWSRLRATALEQVTADAWAPLRAAERSTPAGEVVWLHGRRSLRGAVELEVTLRRPERYLFVPTAGVAARAPVPLRRDPSGGLVMGGAAASPLTYRVWVSPDGPLRSADPPRARAGRPAPDPEVDRLARRIVAGRSTPDARATAVESFLRAHCRYTLEGMHRIGPDPIRWFLLQARQGHCEYFAGGMVVLLEAVGTPARMVAGYNGGEVDGTGSELTVRQDNAHTWVEVWLGPGRGWEVFDPTPVADVPAFTSGSPASALRALWESVQQGWDRYVLTYGLGEQALLLEEATRLAKTALRPPRPGVLAVALAVGGLLWWWGRAAVGALRLRGSRARRRSPAARVVGRLERHLAGVGVEVPAWATVRWVAAAAARRWRGLDDDLAELVRSAERELYDGQERVAGHRRAARRQWARIRRRIRSAGRAGSGSSEIACRTGAGPV